MHKYSIGIHRLLVGVALLPMRMRARMKKQINTVVTGSDHQTCIELVIKKKREQRWQRLSRYFYVDYCWSFFRDAVVSARAVAFFNALTA